jgi:catechol 2,3-dioxygenase-like lactoylglutathione lyase family enzyme
MQKPEMDHMVICANHLEKTLGFYSTVLGALGFTHKPKTIFSRDGFTIQIKQASLGFKGRDNREVGVDHIGFKAPSRKYVERMMIAVENAGYKGGDFIDFDDGAFALFITDPDGFRIEITYYPKP